MKVLIIGGGGREHALAWKVNQSPLVEKIYCAPGNAGTVDIAENLSISATDINALFEFATENSIDLTIVGPEQPLTEGIVDLFTENGLKVFGANKKAAILEGSKSFTKDFCKKYNIPTAAYETFTDKQAAIDYINEQGAPIVVKADGLAAGKGVVVANNVSEAVSACHNIMEHRIYGDAGSKLVVEKFLTGQEASYLVFTDGKTILPLASSQDHKQVFNGDKGPNTGGMGAYSPTPVLTAAHEEMVLRDIIKPTIDGMKAEGRPFKGVLYAGLMIDGDDVQLLEYNVRFGDPETQPLMARMKSDIVPIMLACIDDTLGEHTIEWDDKPAVCVVLTSGGYPGNYKRGFEISGIDEANAKPDSVVFHAGTTLENGHVVTNGGRVLGVTALGDDIKSAIDNAYSAVKVIQFAHVHYRSDIGSRIL